MTGGFTQKEGIDYSDILSPIVNIISIQMLLAIVVELNLELQQMDIKMVFICRDLHETIYMKQIEDLRYQQEGFCKLNGYFYGLTQSPKQWNKHYNNSLQTLDLKVINMIHVFTSSS